MVKQKTGAWSKSLAKSLVAIASLAPDPQNARTHDDRNIEAIAASLQQFGQQAPVIVDADGTVLKGNGTLRAAISLGWTHLAAVRTELTGARARAFAVADNRTAELAGWDNAELSAIFNDLAAIEGLTDSLGFDEKEIESICKQALRDSRPEAVLLEASPVEESAEPNEPDESDPTWEAEEPTAPAPRTQEEKFPISIVLTSAEKHRWDAFRDGRKDKIALMELLDKVA